MGQKSKLEDLYYIDSDYQVRQLGEGATVLCYKEEIFGYVDADSCLKLIMRDEVFSDLQDSDRRRFEMKLAGVFPTSGQPLHRAIILLDSNQIWFNPVVEIPGLPQNLQGRCIKVRDKNEGV